MLHRGVEVRPSPTADDDRFVALVGRKHRRDLPVLLKVVCCVGVEIQVNCLLLQRNRCLFYRGFSSLRHRSESDFDVLIVCSRRYVCFEDGSGCVLDAPGCTRLQRAKTIPYELIVWGGMLPAATSFPLRGSTVNRKTGEAELFLMLSWVLMFLIVWVWRSAPVVL
jgi:hypothetical protein